MLEATGLRKSYGTRAAVVDVSLQVRAGEVLGLLGPNGAGKSTTVGMLCGLITPDAGSVTIAGAGIAADPDAFKRRIGLVPQDLALYEDYSALANLELFGALYGLPHARPTKAGIRPGAGRRRSRRAPRGRPQRPGPARWPRPG